MITLLLVCAALSVHRTEAMFAWYETQQVPIARVFTNIQQRLARNTNDFEQTYYLARLHSMAYATNLLEIAVRNDNGGPEFDWPWSDGSVPRSVEPFANSDARQRALSHLTNAILFYERAIILLKKSTNADERKWMILPTQLGLAWCLDQAGRTNDAIAMYRKTYKAAWHLEVVGDFSFKQWVNEAWNDVRAGRNPLHSHYQSLDPRVCYSEEIIGYLLKLLDPVKDASEIAELKKDQNTLSKLGRFVTPILIPLTPGARFDELVDVNAAVAFDLDGSGLERKWAWLTPKAGWLVYDPDRTGRITSALQMFGNVTFWIFWPDGYQALSVLDDNGDGVVSGVELRGLAIWNDRNCNGVSEPGEVIPVEALGIQSISCTSQPGLGGMRWNPEGVTFTDGSSRATYDWIAPGEASLLGK